MYARHRPIGNCPAPGGDPDVTPRDQRRWRRRAGERPGPQRVRLAGTSWAHPSGMC